jgi:hypothetical protein
MHLFKEINEWNIAFLISINEMKERNKNIPVLTYSVRGKI